MNENNENSERQISPEEKAWIAWMRWRTDRDSKLAAREVSPEEAENKSNLVAVGAEMIHL